VIVLQYMVYAAVSAMSLPDAKQAFSVDDPDTLRWFLRRSTSYNSRQARQRVLNATQCDLWDYLWGVEHFTPFFLFFNVTDEGENS
jgi:hypothetical protein